MSQEYNIAVCYKNAIRKQRENQAKSWDDSSIASSFKGIQSQLLGSVFNGVKCLMRRQHNQNAMVRTGTHRPTYHYAKLRAVMTEHKTMENALSNSCLQEIRNCAKLSMLKSRMTARAWSQEAFNRMNAKAVEVVKNPEFYKDHADNGKHHTTYRSLIPKGTRLDQNLDATLRAFEIAGMFAENYEVMCKHVDFNAHVMDGTTKGYLSEDEYNDMQTHHRFTDN